MNEDAAFLNEQVDRHHAWFSKSLPMIASENVISPMAREMLLSDFGDRYAEGLPHERYYQGNVFVDEVEDRVVALAKKLFRVRHMDPRPISGTVANMAVYFALLEPGDIMTSVALSHGAHISSAKFGAAGMRGVNNVNYPFDVDRMNIDVDGTATLIKLVKPKVAAFGQSVFLFPTPLADLRDAFQEAGCTVWYDGAHVLGLIAGGKFKDPLPEGADVLPGWTTKTLPGPQHGILLSDSDDEKFIKRLQRAVFPGVVSNHHLHAMAALGITLAEFVEFGREYAAQIVRNSKALAQALHERGIKVLAEKHGFTETHTVALDVAAAGPGLRARVRPRPAALPEERFDVRRREGALPLEVRLVHHAVRRDVARDGTDGPRPFIERDERVASGEVRHREDPLRAVVIRLFQQLADRRRAHDVPQDHVGLERFRARRIRDGQALLRDLRAQGRDVSVVVLVEHVSPDERGLADRAFPGHADLEFDDFEGHLHLSISSARRRADCSAAASPCIPWSFALNRQAPGYRGSMRSTWSRIVKPSSK